MKKFMKRIITIAGIISCAIVALFVIDLFRDGAYHDVNIFEDDYPDDFFDSLTSELN